MTREEIMSLSEGEELDNLIAEKVMGWHQEKEYGFLHWLDENNRFMCGVGKYDGFEDEEDLHVLKWHPSSSVLWAWEVIEKMKTKESYEDFIDELGYKSQRELMFEITPFAICRAALLAVMEKA